MSYGVQELDIPVTVNVMAVVAGALVGTLRAGESDDVDVVGMFGLAICFGFSGGLVRDVLLGNLPPAAFQSPVYLAAVLIAAVVGSVFLVYIDRLEKLLWVLDTLSIGLFAAVGVNASLLAGLTFLPAVFVGALASVGGLILADMLQARPSALLHRGPPNIMAGLAAAVVYALLYDDLAATLVTILAVGAAFLVRVAGLRFGPLVPMPRKERIDLRARVRGLWASVGMRRRGAES